MCRALKEKGEGQKRVHEFFFNEGISLGFMPGAERVYIIGMGKGQNFGSLSIYELTRHMSIEIKHGQIVTTLREPGTR